MSNTNLPPCSDDSVNSDMQLNFKKLPIPLQLSLKSLKNAILEEIPTHSFNNSPANIHTSFKLSNFEIDSIRLITSTNTSNEITSRLDDEFISSTSPFLLMKIQISIRSSGLLGLFNLRSRYKFLASYSMIMQSFEYIYYYPEIFSLPKKNGEKTFLNQQIDYYLHNLSSSDSNISIISPQENSSLQKVINSDFNDPNKFKLLTLNLGDIQYYFPKTSKLVFDNFHGLAFGCSTTFCSNYSQLLGENSKEYPPLFKAFSYSLVSKQHNKAIKAYFTKDLNRRGVNKDYISDCVVFDPEYACTLKDEITPHTLPRSALICRNTNDLASFCEHHAYGYASRSMHGAFYHEIILSLANHYSDVFCRKHSIQSGSNKDFITALFILIFEYKVLKNSKLTIEQSVLMYHVFSRFISNGKPFDLQRNANNDANLIGYSSLPLSFSYKYSNIGDDSLESSSSFEISYDTLFERVAPFIQFIYPVTFGKKVSERHRSPNPDRVIKSILKFLIHN